MAEYVTVDGARVGVLMGSASDWPTMEKTSQTLEKLGIVHECNVIQSQPQCRQQKRHWDYHPAEVQLARAQGAKVPASVILALQGGSRGGPIGPRHVSARGHRQR